MSQKQARSQRQLSVVKVHTGLAFCETGRSGPGSWKRSCLTVLLYSGYVPEKTKTRKGTKAESCKSHVMSPPETVYTALTAVFPRTCICVCALKHLHLFILDRDRNWKGRGDRDAAALADLQAETCVFSLCCPGQGTLSGSPFPGWPVERLFWYQT